MSVYESRLAALCKEINLPQATLAELLAFDSGKMSKVLRGSQELKSSEIEQAEKLSADLRAIAADARPLTINWADVPMLRLILKMRADGLHVRTTFERDGGPVEELVFPNK